jgi:hypothetical protein
MKQQRLVIILTEVSEPDAVECFSESQRTTKRLIWKEEIFFRLSRVGSR